MEAPYVQSSRSRVPITRHKSSIFPEYFGLTAECPLVRKMPGRASRPTWRGWSSSHKALGPAFFETTLERDLQTLLSADPKIKTFKVQPHTLTYWSEEEPPVKRRYTPDVAAIDVTGRIIIMDAKASIYATDSKWRVREPYIRRAYEDDHGAQFCVLTEHQIRSQPLLSNCQMMLAHRSPSNPEGLMVMRGIVGNVAGETTIAVLCEAAGMLGVVQGRAFSVVVQMALSDELKLDLSQPLTLNTKVKCGC